jgi:exonuclease VII large subunit
VLARGYSLTRKAGEHAPLLSSAEVAPGDELETCLARGVVRSRVTATEGASHDELCGDSRA